MLSFINDVVGDKVAKTVTLAAILSERNIGEYFAMCDPEYAHGVAERMFDAYRSFMTGGFDPTEDPHDEFMQLGLRSDRLGNGILDVWRALTTVMPACHQGRELLAGANVNEWLVKSTLLAFMLELPIERARCPLTVTRRRTIENLLEPRDGIPDLFWQLAAMYDVSEAAIINAMARIYPDYFITAFITRVSHA